MNAVTVTAGGNNENLKKGSSGNRQAAKPAGYKYY
jgi:hypothetical protein